MSVPAVETKDLVKGFARPLFDSVLEYLVLIGLTLVSYPLGRWVFGRAEEVVRRRGMLAQY